MIVPDYTALYMVFSIYGRNTFNYTYTYISICYAYCCPSFVESSYLLLLIIMILRNPVKIIKSSVHYEWMRCMFNKSQTTWQCSMSIKQCRTIALIRLYIIIFIKLLLICHEVLADWSVLYSYNPENKKCEYVIL